MLDFLTSKMSMSKFMLCIALNGLGWHVNGLGHFELRIIRIDNPRNELFNGDCCKKSEHSHENQDACTEQCTSAIRVCLREYQSVSSWKLDRPKDMLCNLGNATSRNIAPDEIHGTFNEPVVKMILEFDFAWTVRILM